MKKLLISGLGGSLFPYLAECLLTKYELLFIDSNSILKKIYPHFNFFVAPLVTEKGYTEFIKELIKEHKIDFYVPLIDEELLLAKDLIEGYSDVKVISPTKEFIQLSLDKYKLMQQLKMDGISDIPSFKGNSYIDQINPPLFLKPIFGRGSRGIKRINTQNQITSYYSLEEKLPENTLIQPAIEGIEYTVGVTINNLNDIIAISSKKIISKKGITQSATTENNAIITKVVNKVVDKLKPCGPINIQCFLTKKNEIKIFEINPRFSTTSIMEYKCGLDLIDLYISNFNKKYNEKVLSPKEGVMLYRRWENLFYE